MRAMNTIWKVERLADGWLVTACDPGGGLIVYFGHGTRGQIVWEAMRTQCGR